MGLLRYCSLRRKYSIFTNTNKRSKHLYTMPPKSDNSRNKNNQQRPPGRPPAGPPADQSESHRPKRAADMEEKPDGWSLPVSNLSLLTCVALVLAYCVGPELMLSGQLAINSLEYYLLGSLT